MIVLGLGRLETSGKRRLHCQDILSLAGNAGTPEWLTHPMINPTTAIVRIPRTIAPTLVFGVKFIIASRMVVLQT